MEFDRRVQVRLYPDSGERPFFGSGYLIAPRLVLTAAHVLGDEASGPDPGTIKVSAPPSDARGSPDLTAGREFRATLRCYRKTPIIDAALIEVDKDNSWTVPESLQDVAARPPQRWGRLIGTRPHPVSLVGFPRMQQDPGSQDRSGRQLNGHIDPGNQSPDHRYEISSTDPVRKLLPEARTGTRWSGISGAAVLAEATEGDLLCGVARHDLKADGGTILTATPIALLLEDTEFRTKITTYSHGWEPVLEPVEPADLLTPAARARDLHSPAALLRADTEAVAFYGRESELSDLQAWCDNPPAALTVRVLIGPGGQGKSRLARHLTHLRSRTGWAVGHLRSDLTDYDPPPDFAALRTELPLLLVVDYAETRPRLLRRLITDLSSTRHRVRVLLLARSDGEWRTDALNAAPGTRDLLKQAPVVELPPFTPRTRPSENHPQEDGPHLSRETAFRRAASDLARLLPHVATLPSCDWDTLAATVRPPDDLAQSSYDNALTLQLAALTSLLQQGPKPVEAATTAPAEEIILDHEERFWADSAAAPAFRLTLPTSALAAVVAAAALCGAADRDEALHILGVVPILPPDQVPGVAKWLASLYPAEPGRYWGSLQPDRIAEYHASRTVTDHVLSIGDLLTAGSPAQQAQLITVLARAAEAHYNAHRTADSNRVLQTVNTTLDTVNLDHDVLRSASAAIPKSRITNTLALHLSALLVDAGRQLTAENPADYEPALARSLKNLGVRMSEAGQRADALQAAKEAAEIYGRLAAENPAAYEPDLADSLDNLGSRLLEVGQRSDGLKAVRDALKIQRVLAVENPAAYGPDLARSLNNLGVHLSEAGQRAGALKATKEAVETYGQLAAENPAAYEPDLAQSLNNLGSHLSAAGQQSDALKATEKAIKIQRALAVENPAAYEPDLANSLNNLGIRLSMLGQQRDAVKPTEEAVEIYRLLTADNPAAYEPDLARSLMNLGIRLWDVGQQSDGLTATRKAVDIYQRLAEENPAVYESRLALSLTNLGALLPDVGQQPDGLTATRKAVDIYQRLAEDDPGAYESSLADSLINLGAGLSQAGQRTKALTATEKAVEIYRRLAEDNPAAYEPDLVNSLTHLCSRLSEAEQWKNALAANGQAVEIYRRYIAAEPARFGPQLRDALTWQAYLLTKLRRHRDAVEVRRWLTANATHLHHSQT